MTTDREQRPAPLEILTLLIRAADFVHILRTVQGGFRLSFRLGERSHRLDGATLEGLLDALVRRRKTFAPPPPKADD